MTGEFDVKRMTKELVAGELDLNQETKALGNYVLRKGEEVVSNVIRGFFGDYGSQAVDFVKESSDYHYIKRLVADAIAGRYGDRTVEEVPLSELRKESAIGYNWSDGRDKMVYIPRESEIDKIVGRCSNVDKRAVKDYILTHELVESRYLEAKDLETLDEQEHGRMESMILKAYRELSNEGLEYASELHRAAMRVHGLRGRNDPFRQATERNGGFAKAA